MKANFGSPRSTWTLGLCLALVSVSQISSIARADNTEKEALKTAFKNFPVPDRNAAIAGAKIFKKSPLEKASESNEPFSLAAWLTEKCGGDFQYTQSGTSIPWPKVTCEYTPDDGSFGGHTGKFNCLFDSKDAADGKKSEKIKYTPAGKKLSQAETSPSIIAATTANMLGFYSNVYCPAVVTCKNCPSDNPWDNDHSKAPPSNGGSYNFSWAMMEKQPKAFNIKNHDTNEVESQGLDFDELAMLSDDPTVRRQQVIDREAFLLWENFVVDLDAFHFNQRIACTDGVLENGKAVCKESIAYSHDYGHAFYEYLTLKDWKNVPMLVSRNDGKCYGGVTAQTFKDGRNGRPNDDQWLGASFSNEARELLLSKMKKIDRDLWAQIFDLSRAKETSSIWGHKVNFDLFMEGVNSKIQQLENAKCASIDSKQTLLSK